MYNRKLELNALEKLAAGRTCIHRLHPEAKFFVTVLFIVTVISFNRYSLLRLIPFIIYPSLLIALSETPYLMLFRRFLITLPFCLFAGISNAVFDRTVAFETGGVIVSNGVISLITILYKTYLCVMAVLIFTAVTPFAELTRVMRRLRVPGIFIVMFEMTYRYIGVLLNELFSMNIAYSLRSSAGKGIRMRPQLQLRDMGSFTGQLLIRSINRADRVYNAMKCRGYNLSHVPQNKLRYSKRLLCKDVIFLIIVSLFCAVLRIFDVNKLYLGLFGS